MRRIKLRKSRRQSGRTLILHDARNDLVMITADTVIDHAAILDAHRERIQQFGRFAIESRSLAWFDAFPVPIGLAQAVRRSDRRDKAIITYQIFRKTKKKGKTN